MLIYGQSISITELVSINSLLNVLDNRKRSCQIAMFLMREELRASFPGIGSQLGGRDHSTAMHSYEKIRQEIEQNDTLEQEINSIKNKIYNQG